MGNGAPLPLYLNLCCVLRSREVSELRLSKFSVTVVSYDVCPTEALSVLHCV